VRVLAIETATARGSVAIVDAGGVVVERTAPVPGQHLEWLVPAISELLVEIRKDRADIDGLAVSIGPGRFNGLRIGLATASAWAATTGLPVVGISTLDAIAAGVSGALILAVLDVRRGDVAAALYRTAPALTRLTDTVVCPPVRLCDALPSITEPCTVAGDGLERHQPAILAALAPWGAAAPLERWQPRAACVGALGRARLLRGERDDPLTLVPQYARPVDAQGFARP
jgi:tRNA threonylcarbamoyladenosine biosynthesis protein TsaB